MVTVELSITEEQLAKIVKPFRQVYVVVGHTTLMYYSDEALVKNDRVILETKGGTVMGRVSSFGQTINCNPFGGSTRYQAKKHIIENITQQKIYKGEYIQMAGTKHIEVSHLNSNRKYTLRTDLDVAIGDVVVFECGVNPGGNQEHGMMSVGVVTNTDVMCHTSVMWVVDTVDLKEHTMRKERLQKAETLKARLNEKKKQFQDIELLNLIASKDPETKELLDQYLELIGK